MTQVLASLDLSQIETLGTDFATLTFMEDADYEFVGGGTAVNSL